MPDPSLSWWKRLWEWFLPDPVEMTRKIFKQMLQWMGNRKIK